MWKDTGKSKTMFDLTSIPRLELGSHQFYLEIYVGIFINSKKLNSGDVFLFISI